MSGAFSLTGDLRHVNKRLRDTLADLGGAKSPELKAAAVVLARSVRRVLSTRGEGPAAPGSPPHRHAGRLAKSVAQGVVGTGRRVAVMWFTGPLLEAGVNTGLPAKAGKRRRRAGQARRQLVIAARPFMQAALDRVQDELVDSIVTAHTPRLEGL